jgi:hypothetical protein
MTVDDVISHIASIKNNLYKGNLLNVTTKLIQLKKMLEEYHLQKQVDSIMHDVAVENRKPKHEIKVDLIEAKLNEINTHVSQYRVL